jgi:hypothetical protein
LTRTHAEIETRSAPAALTGLGDHRVQPEDVVELRRLLYGVYAVLRLHNAQQEEEGAFSLVPNEAANSQAAAAVTPASTNGPAAERGTA